MARGSSQPGRDQRQVERRLHPPRGLGGRQGELAICTNRNLKIKCRFGKGCSSRLEMMERRCTLVENIKLKKNQGGNEHISDSKL